MTDFKPKPEKAENEQAAQGDPLLELTRLFASRAKSRKKGDGVTDSKQQMQDDNQISDESWTPALSARPTGISMTGSVLMGDYSAAATAAPLPDPVSEDEGSLAKAAPDWMVEDAPYEEASFPLPVQESSLDEADEVGEQIFHALAGDLQVEDAGGLLHDDESLPNALPELSPQNADFQNSGFSDGYFGYGQSVQIDVFAAARKAAPLSVSTPPPSPPDNPRPSRPAPVAPPPAPPPAPNPLDSFAETLNDFDLTIQRDKRHRRSRSASVSTPLEVTEAFELPPVHHDSVPPLPIEEGFDGDFPGSLTAEQNFFALPPEITVQNKRSSTPEDTDFRGAETSLYDWSVPAKEETAQEIPRSAPKRRKLAAFFLIALLGGLGTGGYWLYNFYELGNGEPVLIKALPGSIKIKPEAKVEEEAQTQDVAVYDQDNANSPPSSQATLIDGSEPPVNLDLLEVAPSQTTSSPPVLNQDALDPVDASILAATERVVPVHIVPTVAIERDEQGNISDIPSSQEKDEVFMPAGDYRSQILQQIEQNGGLVPLDLESSAREGEQGLGAQTESRILENVSEQTSSPITSEVTDIPLPDDQPLSPPETAREQSPPSGEETATQTATTLPTDVGVVNDDSSPSIPNPPALIPTKPEPSELLANAAASPPARQQAATASSETVVDERFYVQISSQPSRDAAIESVADVKRRFASLIGNNQVVIVPADIPGRGIYYRVRVLVSKNSDAVTLCERYQAAGGNCFVGR